MLRLAPRSGVSRLAVPRLFFFSPLSEQLDFEKQQRKRQLGETVEQLRAHVPAMLHRLLPKPMVLRDVYLRVCPLHFDKMGQFLPHIKGHVLYYATLKALRLLVTSLVVDTQLRIEHLKVTHDHDPRCMFADSTKVVVRWTTRPDGCAAPGPAWLRVDPEKIRENWPRTLWADLSKVVLPHGHERVVLGVFIFELSDDMTQVVAHTIDDMELVERKEELPIVRVC